MGRPRIELNEAGMVELLSNPAVTRGPAERVLAAARAGAPVDTGRTRDSLHVEAEQHRDRLVHKVIDETDYALVVEARTGFLSRSLDSA